LLVTFLNLNGSRGFLLWKRGESEIRLDNADVWEDLLGILSLEGWVDNDIVTWNPVDWGGDAVLVTSLQAVDNTEDLGGVSASGGWVGENETDSLLWVNDEDRADGESNALGVNIGGVLVVNHVIEQGNLSLLVTNDWEGEVAASDLVDVGDPSTVGFNGVGRKTNQLDTTFGKLWLELSKGTEFGSADWSVVFWVGEENNPAVTNELVEVNVALAGFSLEVGSSATQTKRLRTVGGHCDFFL